MFVDTVDTGRGFALRGRRCDLIQASYERQFSKSLRAAIESEMGGELETALVPARCPRDPPRRTAGHVALCARA